MTIEVKSRWGIKIGSVEFNSNNCRLTIPKDVREGLDWKRKFDKGLTNLVWLDIHLDDSSALVTSLYGEDIIETVEKLRHTIRTSDFV